MSYIHVEQRIVYYLGSLGVLGPSFVLCMDIPGGSLGAGLDTVFWTEMPGGNLGGP